MTRESETGPSLDRVYDLEERTAIFGEAVIDFLKQLPRDDLTQPLISQLVRSATSVGANYCEADDGVSRADFRHRIGTRRKEAKECKFWLRMIARAVPARRGSARTLWKEVKELHLIFSHIFWKTRPQDQNSKRRRAR